MNSSAGTLYLLPVPLSDGAAPRSCLTEAEIGRIAGLRHFIVENVRSARRFLRKVHPGFPIDECTFTVLDEHSRQADVPAMLAPPGGGRGYGGDFRGGVPGRGRSRRRRRGCGAEPRLPGGADGGAVVAASGADGLGIQRPVFRLRRLPPGGLRRPPAPSARHGGVHTPHGADTDIHRDPLPQQPAHPRAVPRAPRLAETLRGLRHHRPARKHRHPRALAVGKGHLRLRQDTHDFSTGPVAPPLWHATANAPHTTAPCSPDCLTISTPRHRSPGGAALCRRCFPATAPAYCPLSPR